MTCKDCPLRRTCTEICSYLEPFLPSMERGRVDHEDLLRLYQGRLMTQALLDHAELLTPRQQEVVQLYYRETLPQADIAERLSITQQAVADALQRARATVSKELRKYIKFSA